MPNLYIRDIDNCGFIDEDYISSWKNRGVFITIQPSNEAGEYPTMCVEAHTIYKLNEFFADYWGDKTIGKSFVCNHLNSWH